MFFVGTLLTLGGLGFLCWLLFTLAIYAFPVFCGLWISVAAYHSGAGIVGAFALALIAGAVVFVVGQLAFSTARSPLIRVAIALLYAAPACLAAYQATLGLARIGTPSEAWCQLFALAGAAAVGATAWARLARVEVTRADRVATHGRARLPQAGATRTF
jgi:hypothetical protein